MAGSRGFSSSVLLLLWLCHPGLVSLKTIYKKVGDTVEISSGLPTEGIKIAKWKYNNETVSDIGRNITHPTFGNRLNFNSTTHILTIKELTLQDSGNFSFISAQNRKQRTTVVITVLVQESITEEPILTSTHISRDSNQTCRVLVNCSLKSTSSVHYTLIFGNQIHNGSSNQYSIKKEGKGEVFRCTAHNHVSSRTTSKTVTCQDNSTEEHKPKAEVKITKSPVGGRVTLSCSVKPSSGWSFFWFRGEKPSKLLTGQDAIFLSNGQISVSQGRVYRCRGGRGEPVYHTEFSDPVSINEPVLRVSPWWLSPGASVTLSCELEHVSAGWSFYWYKAVPDLSHKSGSYSYELLHASSNGTADNSYIIHGQTHTAGYVCRAGRGEPHVYTLYSQPHFVWSGDLHPSASLSVSPDRVQHFTSDSVSLTCEGNSAEWRVSRFLLPDLLSFCSDWGTMNGSTCHVQKIQSSNAVFWCESGSAFSNAVNITGHYDDLILLSPVHPVTEGHSVTLGCKLRTENLLSKVFFYQKDTLIQNDSRVEMIIPAVSKSHEGFYKCQSSGKESLQSWLAVTSSRSSSIVPLAAGFACLFVIIILLLLMIFFKKSKNSCFTRSQNSNRSSPPEQSEAHQIYCSPGSVQSRDLTLSSIELDNITEEESEDVNYASVQVRNFGKNRRKKTPVEDTVYSDLKTRPDDSQLYAAVSHLK